MFDLKGKVALVTGAAKGIGLGYCKELFRNGVKAISIIDLDETNGQKAVSDFNKQYGNNCAIFIKADVSNKLQLEEAFQTTVETFNQLDIVINNAAIIQEKQWEKCVAVNLVGVINGSMLAMEKYLPKYRSTPEGVILNTASIVGLRPFEENPTYAATKHGVIGFSRALGGDVHYKTSQVRVVAICPGLTDTTFVNVTAEQVGEPYLSIMLNTVKSIPSQSTQEVAKSMIEVLQTGSNGSIWLAISANCSNIKFPDYF